MHRKPISSTPSLARAPRSIRCVGPGVSVLAEGFRGEVVPQLQNRVSACRVPHLLTP